MDSKYLKSKNEGSFTPKQEEIPDLLSFVEELAIFGFWEWNIQTGIVLWSDHLYAMFGLNKENFEATFENFFLVVHDKDKEYVRQKVSDAIEQQITLDYFFTGVMPSGEERIFQTWGGMKLDDKGNPLRFVGVVIDNTDTFNKQNEIQKLNNQLKLKNNELNSSNRLLEKKHTEKEALLKEIHHRVKNNLQVVNSLIRYQSSKINDSKTTNALKDIENRIFAISSLHEKLYQSHDLRHISLAEHFEQLIENLIESCRTNIDVKATVIIDKTKLSTEQLIPLGLILNELITNSIEHGFIGMKKGEVHFHLSSNSNNEVRVIFGDNGIGTKNNEEAVREDSIGLDLVAVFTEQINGTLKQLNKRGTFYELTFKCIDCSQA